MEHKINKKLKIIEKSCEDKKGINIQTLDIRDMTSIADYFVIVSGNSRPQVHAIADEVMDKMYEAGYEPYNTEGQTQARWVVLDYGDIVVHVFHREEREFYSLERLWTKENNVEEEE